VKAGTWPSPPIYVEDVFSTYLFTGNALASQTITNNIDVSGKGGLVWIKSRNTTGSDGNYLQDTARGATSTLVSNSSAAATSGVLSSFTSSGFVQTAGWGTSDFLASWTFAKQPKFFDVVTYTGTGVARTISHNLNAAPGFMVVKRTDAISGWPCSFVGGGTQYILLNDGTTINATDSTVWNGATATSSDFSVGTSTLTNASGGTYVAYLFANSAGGFGVNKTDSVVASGTVTTIGGIATVTLGWEPQWVLFKWNLSSAGGYYILDVMRGATVSIASNFLKANASTDENNGAGIFVTPNATGFTADGTFAGVTNQQFRYLAIRRGPMKTPTVGTDVFLPTSTSAAAGTSLTVGFPADMTWVKNITGGVGEGTWINDRLRGYSNIYSATSSTTGSPASITSSGAAETASQYPLVYKVYNTTELVGSYFGGSTVVNYNFRRAPGFFDVVAYTGTGTAGARSVNHNLGVVPGMIIVKARNGPYQWGVYQSTMANTDVLYLDSTQAKDTGMITWGSTTPTSTLFYVGNTFTTNGGSVNYIAYLFATLAGISKVGSFTGTGALQTIDCGFTTGARFVLIKRSTVAAGSWYVYDSARGISSSSDPYYLLESTALQVTGTDYVDTDTTGFKLNAAGSTTVNISGASYIFLAIA
jgi:hypothetical protein